MRWFFQKGSKVERMVQSYADPKEARRKMVARQPVGRLSTAEEIAGAILYLASPEARFATGSALVIDLSAKQKSLDSWYYTCMSAYQTDSRIDDYIATLPGWQQELCLQVRELVHAADPEVTETIKRTRQPYFTLQGNICALLGAKDHLNIFIYDPMVPDPEGLINQGHGNRTARAIQVRQGEIINQSALLTIFRAIIANNRAGGWRKLKGSQ